MTTEVNAPTIFDRAANVFDGWTDADTGMRVLRLWASNMPRIPGMFRNFYHQFNPFLDGGQKFLMHGNKTAFGDTTRATYMLELTTGMAEEFGPAGYHVTEVFDATKMAALRIQGEDGERAVLWDLQADKEVASVCEPGWKLNSQNMLSDGRRMFVFFFRGKCYTEPVQSRHYLLTPGEEPQLILDLDGYFCSHVQSCPTDVNLYCCDRWPSPKRDIEQTITLRTLDNSFEETVKLDEKALRPADMWGCRDHYVWSPDGNRIVSYFCPQPIVIDEHFNHFKLDWWLSALDWRTGEDLAARYPAGRWGGHMQMSPDAKYIICTGGPGFDKLYAVNVEGLRQGWNEEIICAYPKTVSEGKNGEPCSSPFALPDGSGVIFNAGWPGDNYGTYLAEWPATLR